MPIQFHTLTTGWRAHLVGSRRVWHPYHHFSLAGYRAGWAVARPAAQAGQLARAVAFLQSILSRGGRVWGFGAGFQEGPTQWGRVWPEWLPGQITNCVYHRARQAFALGHHRGLSRPAQVNRPRRTRFDRGLPFWGAAQAGRVGFALYRLPPTTPAGVGPGWGGTPGWSTTVKSRFRRLCARPALARAARQTRTAPPPRGRSRGWAATQAVPVRLAVRRGVHLGRYRARRPASYRAARPARQYQTPPFGFPSAVVAVGSGSNRGLLGESSNLTLPVVYFYPVGFSPGLTPLGVLWGAAHDHPKGVAALLGAVHTRVWTARFLHTVWARLC